LYPKHQKWWKWNGCCTCWTPSWRTAEQGLWRNAHENWTLQASWSHSIYLFSIIFNFYISVYILISDTVTNAAGNMWLSMSS